MTASDGAGPDPEAMVESDGQQPYRFAVTGGRDFTDERLVRLALGRVRPDAVMVNGDCPTGLDAIAKRVWQGDGRQVELHPADWATHGKAAGPLRNETMARSGITSVLVFPGGRGTADMRRRCVAAGVRWVVDVVDQERDIREGYESDEMTMRELRGDL